MSLTVNSSFAAGYEKRKRAEELTRYKQSDLEALGLLSDDSASSEDEDGQELSRRKSKRIDEVVAMIERKDLRQELSRVCKTWRQVDLRRRHRRQ